MTDISEKIRQALEDVEFLSFAKTHTGMGLLARERLLSRANKRLDDLVAVRDGKAREVYATVAANRVEWAALGRFDAYDPLDPEVVDEIRDPGDRLTILRGIAYLPVDETEEAEAESEET